MTDATITVGADASAFSNVIDKCKSKLQDMGQSMGGALMPAGKLGETAALAIGGVAAAATAAAAAAAAFGAAMVKAVSAAADFEIQTLNYQAFFPKDQAAAFVEELRTIKQESILDGGTFDNAAKSLLRAGMNAADTAATLRQLGSVAMASGKSVDGLAAALLNVKLRGVNARTLNALAGAGYDAAGALAARDGISRAAALEAAGAGRYQFGDIISGLGYTGAVQAGLHEQAAATMKSAWGTLNDEILRMFEQLGDGMRDALTGPLGEVTAALKAAGPVIKQIGDAVASGFSYMWQTVGGIMRALYDAISPAGKAFWSLVASVGKLAMALGRALSPLTKLQVAVLKLAGGALAIAAQLIAKLADAIAWLVDRLTDALNWVGDLFSGGSKTPAPAPQQGAQRAAAASMVGISAGEIDALPDAPRSGDNAAQQWADAVRGHADRMTAAAAAGMSAARQIEQKLAKVGAASVAELRERIAYWEGMPTETAEALARYKELAGAMEEITALQNEITARDKQRADAWRETENAYDNAQEKARYDALSLAEKAQYLEQRSRAAGVTDNGADAITEKIRQLGAQADAGQVRQLRELRDMWRELETAARDYADARENAYTKAGDGLRALKMQLLEETGDRAAAEAMRTEDRRAQLEAGGISAAAAAQIADLESRIRQARETGARENAQYGGRWIGGQNYSAGFGGDATFIRNATSQLTESKAQTGHLKSLLEELKKVERIIKNDSGGIPVVA